jgi:hypothetical protein
MQKLVENPKTDLFARFPTATARRFCGRSCWWDHNAYHLGELVLVRRLLGAWPGA